MVRELRTEGRRDEAATVARLRRPTAAAWAVNVAARAHPAAVRDLLTAGEALRKAQEKALRGDASALRTATAKRRDAVAALAAHAAEVLGDRAPAQASAVSATLEAATVDESVAELLRAGRLDKERSASAAGFGFGDVGDWTPPPRKPATKKQPAPEKRPAKAAKAEPAKPDTRKELDTAVRDAKAAAKELHDAEERVAALRKELAEATAAARTARTKANRAELHAETLRQKAWEAGERRRQST